MSTIVAQTLSNGTVSTSTENCIQGSAKAWLNYNGTTQTIRGSFNVSSVTRNSGGDYTVNFTTAMPNANYAAPTGGRLSAAYRGFSSIQSQSTGSVNIICHSLITTGGLYYPYVNSQEDHDIITVAVFD